MRRLFIGLVLAAAVLLVVAAIAGYVGFTRLHEPYKGYAEEEQFVEIAPGSGPARIGQQLVDAGVVRDPLTFRAAVWLSGRARELKAGEYRFDRPVSAMEVVDKLARGDIYRRLVTFREGLTIREMAMVYERAGLGSAADFEQAAADPAAIRDIDPDAPDLEGYLFPDTYSLARVTPAPALVRQMVGSFRKALDEQIRSRIAEKGMTIRQAVTLASLVEKETAVPDERPLVAAVYLNRLKIGMPMQADPTVIYALQQHGRYDGNIRRDDLQLDSPYNTYRYPGLPPGPIASPGRASLEAVANPADVDYLYFVSRNDGSHVFARTLEEHNRNVHEWQIKYFRERRRSTNGSPR